MTKAICHRSELLSTEETDQLMNMHVIRGSSTYLNALVYDKRHDFTACDDALLGFLTD